MGKYFEITYAPSQWDAPPGGIASAWSVPYGGLNVQFPENQIGPNYTPAMNNFMFRNGELRSRYALQPYLPGPDGQNPILGIGSFLSAALVWHTFAFTANGLWQLSGSAQSQIQYGINPWQGLGGPQLLPSPVAWYVFQNILYYTNGNGHLSAWNGAALNPITDVAFSGTTWPLPNNYTGTTFSGLFLGELAGQVLMAYTYENTYTSGVITGTSTFAQRVRWSCVNFNPTLSGTFGANLGQTGGTWDPTVNVGAGFNDMLDVPDVITGLMTIGRVGYIFRQNGITEISPTGVGTAPFDFNHLWASQQGVGSVYPDTIAQYGQYGVFVANDNVYQLTPSSTGPIGGSARDAIMLDLSNAVGPPVAAIIPGYSVATVYLVYKLMIPLPTGTRIYVYSFDDANWASWFHTGVYLGHPYPCWIGDTGTEAPYTASAANNSNGTGGGSGGGGGGGGGGGIGGRGGGGGHIPTQ